MIKTCIGCKKNYKTIRQESLYCNNRCYHLHDRGKDSHAWKGGKYLSKYGYWYIHAPHNHPYETANGYIFEHRIIMERYLNRYLKPTELVHHINGIKTDNRIENLVVITKREHNNIHLNSPSYICLIPNCGNKFKARGYCMKHYDQYRNKSLPKEFYRYYIHIKEGSK